MIHYMKLLFIIIFCCSLRAGMAGDKPAHPSEKAIFKQAERHFVKKEYEQALPLYARLITAHGDNYKLNYCYGICLLITDKDKALSVKYLEEASRSILVWDDVWYYLGRAYQLCGDYPKSISAYDQFVKMVSPKQALRWEALHQMEMCKSAIILTGKPDSLTILDLKTMSREQLDAGYQLVKDDRKLLNLPEEFSSAKDRQNPDCLNAFLSADGNKMVYASYGSDRGRNLDIFMVEKNQKGTWTKPKRLSESVNTIYDDCFPTFSEDGNTLYFSSKGHNSMGGYDLFRSVYYPQTRQWSKAENMGVPVNSSDDDFYLVSSEMENKATFCSKRGCAQGDVSVYNMKLFDDSSVVLIVNGEVINEYAPPVRFAKIRVVKMDNDSLVHELTSDAVNGKFRYTLPATGSYRISVRVEGFGPMAQSIYFSPESKGHITQIIRVSKDSVGYDHLKIGNRFGEAARVAHVQSDPVPAMEPAVPSAPEQTGNQKVSTGFEPITMYSVNGMPPVSDDAREKLKAYFAELHAHKPSPTDNMLVNMATVNDGGTTYQVQIGTFMHQTVEQVYEKLKEMGLEDISYYTNKKGWNIFYTGRADEISASLKLKQLVIAYGFDDAFITVFENGKPSRSSKR